MTKSHLSKSAGFTLIELLVTTAITTIILLAASTVLMTFFLSSSRTAVRRQLKAEGNRALSRIEFVARGARDCALISGGIRFTTLDGDLINVVVSGTNIVMDGENLLSFGQVQAGSTTFECVQETATAKKYTNIEFDLINSSAATIEENFRLLTVLRNS